MADLVQGRIASAPDSDDRVMVTVDAFAADQLIGPCRYMPRGALAPAEGDVCVVAQLPNGEDWVIAFDG